MHGVEASEGVVQANRDVIINGKKETENNCPWPGQERRKEIIIKKRPINPIHLTVQIFQVVLIIIGLIYAYTEINNSKSAAAEVIAETRAEVISHVKNHIDNTLTYTEFSKVSWNKIKVHPAKAYFLRLSLYIGEIISSVSKRNFIFFEAPSSQGGLQSRTTALK